MKILFLCTHDSCHSILHEAIFNHLTLPLDTLALEKNQLQAALDGTGDL
ncbi:hypothetical protein [Cellvibrio sp. UBA7661]